MIPKKKLIPSSRWEELRDTVKHQIEVARIICAPTSFRLLNNPGVTVGPQKFGICESDESCKLQEAQLARDVMDNVSPNGLTPLTNQINEIYQEIKNNEAYLRSCGKVVSVIIATDGLPTDWNGDEGAAENANFNFALRQLEDLPIWILIRLCTNDENVTEFYNNLDSQKELSIEVLDDFSNEAEVVHILNPWLNYGFPLHRLREIGTHVRLLDFLDEHEYSLSEIRDFIKLILGDNDIMDNAPDPNIDLSEYNKFMKSEVLSKEQECWNPIKSKALPWIDMKKLCRMHGPSLGGTMKSKSLQGINSIRATFSRKPSGSFSGRKGIK